MVNVSYTRGPNPDDPSGLTRVEVSKPYSIQENFGPSRYSYGVLLAMFSSAQTPYSNQIGDTISSFFFRNDQRDDAHVNKILVSVLGCCSLILLSEHVGTGGVYIGYL